MARLRSLLVRTPQDTLCKVDEVIQEQLASGVIEEAPRQINYSTHYLPHRPVVRNSKIRIVYDASVKTKTGNSLNMI